jgi:hypothetical protein
LQALSFLGQSPIPDSLLRDVADEADLTQWSLVRRVPAGFELNPLIGPFARDFHGAEEVVSMVRLPQDRQGLERARPHLDALVEQAGAIVPAEIARLLVQLGRNWLAIGGWHEARARAEDALRLVPGDASAVALRHEASGRTVVLLGDARAALTEELRTAFGKERFEVVDSGDPVEYLVTSPHRIDCVVAVSREGLGKTSGLEAQIGLARLIGVECAVGAVMPGLANIPIPSTWARTFPTRPW